MKKKSTEKKNSTTTPEYNSKREQNVLLEKMYKEIKTISEGHSFISDKIEEMDRTLRKLDSNSFKIEMDVQAIKSKTGTIDIKTDRIEKELETVKEAVLENSKEVKDIKKIYEDHEERLKKLEAVS